nr:adhesion G-protein coupled receptor D1-like isoform X2 [Pocillopora verrucosa]
MMTKMLDGLASLFRLAAFFLVIQGCWAIAEQNDTCTTAPFLNRSKCEHSNCRNFLESGWRKIKCSPFVFGARQGSCSTWCKKLYSLASRDKPPCQPECRSVFLNQGIDTGKIPFRVVPCGAFVFIITLKVTRNFEVKPIPSWMNDLINLSNIEVNKENALQVALPLFATAIKKIRFRHKQRDILADEEGEEAMFSSFALEEFIIRFSKRRLKITNPEANATSKELAFQVRRNVHRKGRDFLFNGSNGENFIKIPSANLHPNGSVVLGIEYNSLQELFSNYSAGSGGTNKTWILDSKIISAVVDPLLEVLTENVTLVFQNTKVNRKKRTCVFWSFSEENFGGWSSEGCQTKMISDHYTECVCNHLTHFAVLMDFTNNADDGKFFNQDKTRSSDEHDKILTLLTRVGMALSLTGVALTIISYLQLTDRNLPLCHIRVSLTSCIGAGHIIFFAGIDFTENQAACVAVAALMQYFLMASFCWMLVEGIYIYLFVVKVYNISDKMYRYHGFCWGLPAIVVAVSLPIAAGNDGIETFVNDENCWMSSSNNIIWIFVSFVGLIAIINMMILVRVIKELTTIQHVKGSQTEQIRLGVRACVVLAPLLGVTWLIGFLVPLHIAFSYIFVILNSNQGFFIFFCHCLGNSEIRGRFKRRILKVLPDASNQRQGDNRGNSQARQSHNDTGIPVQDRE